MKLRKTKAVSPLDEFVKGNINKTTLVLWYYFRSKADDTGAVWGVPTKTILAETHTCPRSFYAAVKKLRQMEVLDVKNTVCTDVCDPEGSPLYIPVKEGYDLRGERLGPNVYYLIGG